MKTGSVVLVGILDEVVYYANITTGTNINYGRD